jgi:hypothetical protein
MKVNREIAVFGRYGTITSTDASFELPEIEAIQTEIGSSVR